MSPGYIAVQSTHSIADFAHRYPTTFLKWKEDIRRSLSHLPLLLKNNIPDEKTK